MLEYSGSGLLSTENDDIFVELLTESDVFAEISSMSSDVLISFLNFKDAEYVFFPSDFSVKAY